MKDPTNPKNPQHTPSHQQGGQRGTTQPGQPGTGRKETQTGAGGFGRPSTPTGGDKGKTEGTNKWTNNPNNPTGFGKDTPKK